MPVSKSRRPELRKKVIDARNAAFRTAQQQHSKRFTLESQKVHFKTAFDALLAPQVDWTQVDPSIQFIENYLKSRSRVNVAMKKAVTSESRIVSLPAELKEKIRVAISEDKKSESRVRELIQALYQRKKALQN